MKMKIACFGVRDYEISYFNDLARKYDYEVDLFPQFLNQRIKRLNLLLFLRPGDFRR